MSRLRAVPPLLLSLLVACHDEQPRTHVYRSPPPVTSPVTAQVKAPVRASTGPEIPIGTKGASARLVSIADAASGAPVPLFGITDSVDVLTIVALGPHAEPAPAVRIELVLRGTAMDTTLVLQLAAPAPSVIAHAFRVSGLKEGRYTCVVRLLTSGGRVLAESIATYLEVITPSRGREPRE